MFKTILKKILRITESNSNSLEYWKNRVKKFGKRSVINIDHPGDDFDRIKKRDKDALFPILSSQLKGDEQIILDFGCGSGRFTSDLADLIHGTAIGVDPTQELIKFAIPNQNVTFQVMKEGEIPLTDDSVDVVWIYAVLGGIKGAALAKTLASIHRVLKKNGLLFITENTSDATDSKFWTYRDVATLQKLITFVPLSHLYDYFDSGHGFNERFSVLAGRKKC